MNALAWRIAPYLAAALFVGGVLFVAYSFGVERTEDRYEQQISEDKLKHAQEINAINEAHRLHERKAAEDLAAVGITHQEAIQHEKADADRIITDLRSGAVRMRNRLAFTQYGTSGLPAAAAATGQRDGPQGVGLQTADAELVLRIASDADQVADQLRACQAVVRADRVKP